MEQIVRPYGFLEKHTDYAVARVILEDTELHVQMTYWEPLPRVFLMVLSKAGKSGGTRIDLIFPSSEIADADLKNIILAIEDIRQVNLNQKDFTLKDWEKYNAKIRSFNENKSS